MYYLTKQFEVPISHRLSKHKGRCHMFHGHNLLVEVTIKSFNLDKNDMVMDFSDLKKLVNSLIDSWDHGMFINEDDKELVENKFDCSLHIFPCDPTSEVLCKSLFDKLKSELLESKKWCEIFVESITIWETSTSKSTYRE